MPGARRCLVFRLGRVEYPQALPLQRRLATARARGDFPDALLLLEHPPVFTLGAGGGEGNLLVSRDFLAGQGIKVYATDRGGDITYHGPGQLVGYPILKLEGLGLGVTEYVRCLEEVLIAALREFGVRAGRLPGQPGVWMGAEKIAAIGLRVSRGVSYHGFALNVSNDLLPFSYIHPCGIQDKGVTSLSRLLNREVEVAQVVPPLLRHFSRLFSLKMEERPGFPLPLRHGTPRCPHPEADIGGPPADR